VQVTVNTSPDLLVYRVNWSVFDLVAAALGIKVTTLVLPNVYVLCYCHVSLFVFFHLCMCSLLVTCVHELYFAACGGVKTSQRTTTFIQVILTFQNNIVQTGQLIHWPLML